MNWTQQDLADATGLSVTAIAMIERGERKPMVETADRIVRALHITWQFVESAGGLKNVT